MFRRKVESTQFDVKWAISRKRGYSEDVRKYHTLGFLATAYEVIRGLCDHYVLVSYVVNI